MLDIARKRRAENGLQKFQPEALDANFMRRVVQMSWHAMGPKLACDLIEEIGIPVVFERHFSGTYLDGAALLDHDGGPVIGLTLRIDRIDNFWYTLMHELAHVMRHLSGPGDAFFDRLDDFEATETLELEANRIARDALIPRAAWRRSELVAAPNRERILRLAKELTIHPAIVAGRVRRETGDFRLFGDLLGVKEVSRQLANDAN